MIELHGQIGKEVDVGSSPEDVLQVGPEEARRLALERCIESLVHACHCKNVKCQQPPCKKMKRVFLHTHICKRKKERDCPICKQLIGLCCYHARSCQNDKCLVPKCNIIKNIIRMQ